jgi:hypothetical protein
MADGKMLFLFGRMLFLSPFGTDRRPSRHASRHASLAALARGFGSWLWLILVMTVFDRQIRAVFSAAVTLLLGIKHLIIPACALGIRTSFAFLNTDS